MMKFSCEKALLQSAIAVTSRAVAQKSSIPALEGLLLRAGQELTVSGYNMNTGIRTKLSAGVDEAGEIVLNARLLPGSAGGGGRVRRFHSAESFAEHD